MESLAGAVFLDSDFNLDRVWNVFKKILKPLVTPETLRLEPIRELRELCQKQKFGDPKFKMERGTKGDFLMTVTVQVKNETIMEVGRKGDKKSAKKIAAIQALSSLKVKTLAHLFGLNTIWSAIVDNGVAQCTLNYYHVNRSAWSSLRFVIHASLRASQLDRLRALSLFVCDDHQIFCINFRLITRVVCLEE